MCKGGKPKQNLPRKTEDAWYIKAIKTQKMQSNHACEQLK